MGRVKLLNQRQDEAVNSWNGIGTINAAVGFGKNFTAFKCILKALDNNWIKKKDIICFYAETVQRESTLKDELKKFKKIFKKDLSKMFDIQFYCYQSLPKVNSSLDIYDEIHDALTPKYKEVIEKGAKYKIGLSATISKNSNLYKDQLDYTQVGKVYQSKKQKENGDDSRINKGQLLEELCPICFVYTLKQGIKENILSPYETFIIEHTLDDTTKNLKIWKTKDLKGTEKDYYNKRASMKNIYTLPFYRKQQLGKEMSQFLWELDSKVILTRKLLNTLEGKTIVFGTRLDPLEKITPNVVRGKTNLIEDFNSGKIHTIASSKKLKQGITLEGVENCILFSYYSKSADLIQMLGRIVRFVEGKVAKLYIVVTLNTFEEKWFKNMTKIYNEKGKLESELDLNIKKYISSKNYE